MRLAFAQVFRRARFYAGGFPPDRERSRGHGSRRPGSHARSKRPRSWTTAPRSTGSAWSFARPPAAATADKPGWLGAKTKIDGGRLLVENVPRGTPARPPGVNPGDEILAIDDFRVLPDKLRRRGSRPIGRDRRSSLLVSRRDELKRLRSRWWRAAGHAGAGAAAGRDAGAAGTSGGMASLTRALARQVPPAVRAKGAAYYERGAVVHADAESTRVDAIVRVLASLSRVGRARRRRAVRLVRVQVLPGSRIHLQTHLGGDPRSRAKWLSRSAGRRGVNAAAPSRRAGQRARRRVADVHRRSLGEDRAGRARRRARRASPTPRSST